MYPPTHSSYTVQYSIRKYPGVHDQWTLTKAYVSTILCTGICKSQLIACYSVRILQRRRVARGTRIANCSQRLHLEAAARSALTRSRTQSGPRPSTLLGCGAAGAQETWGRGRAGRSAAPPRAPAWSGPRPPARWGRARGPTRASHNYWCHRHSVLVYGSYLFLHLKVRLDGTRGSRSWIRFDRSAWKADWRNGGLKGCLTEDWHQ